MTRKKGICGKRVTRKSVGDYGKMVTRESKCDGPPV